MKQNWKRNAAALSLALAVTVPMAGAASAVPIGTAVDHVLYTDIVARISSLPIRSYNMSGYTVIAAEDLLDYGFDVVWNGERRTLSISLNTDGKEITANYEPEENTHPIGAVAGDVLATDIVTWVTDYWGRTYQIPSWNIGTQTVVNMDDLAKAFGFNYSWDDYSTPRELSFINRHYTAWSQEIPIPEQTNELKQGFAVKLTKPKDSDTFQVEGEGEWGAIDNLTVSATGVSFSVYQRVTNTSGLSGLTSAVATFDPERDNIIQNKQENNDWRRAELKKHFWVSIDGWGMEGELWRGHGNGHTDYSFQFENPTSLEDLNEIYIVVGEPLWVADHSIPYQWEDQWKKDFYSSYRGTCETFTPELAHIYHCSRPTDIGWSTARAYESLYVVWPDGTKKDFLEELQDIWRYSSVESYYVNGITLNEDKTAFTFQWPVYEVHGEFLSPEFNIEHKGMGTWRVDLATREMTLESIAAD